MLLARSWRGSCLLPSRRAFATTAAVCQRRALPPRKGAVAPQRAKPAAATAAAATVATQLFSLRQHHRHEALQCHEAQCEATARAAWQVLEAVTERDVDAAPLEDVAEMLAAWAYFSQFWARGLDGPAVDRARIDASAPSLETLGVPLVSREMNEARAQAAQREESMPPPPRRSPLDDILEF